jgi:glutamate decarboxylase
MTTASHGNDDVALFGNRFATQEVPTRTFPSSGMPAQDAFRLVAEDLALEGDPARNLATFVTTWMEPEAQRIIADEPAPQLHRPREYPRTAEIEQRCNPHARRPLPRAGRDHRRRVPRARPRRSCSGLSR